jgi:hypothetical protein
MTSWQQQHYHDMLPPDNVNALEERLHLEW